MKLVETKNFEKSSTIHEEIFSSIGQTKKDFREKAPLLEGVILKELILNEICIGYILYRHEKNSNELKLLWMGVIDKYRGGGAGRFLLDDAIKYARVKKCKYVRVVTRDRFKSALKLYKALGFETEDILEDEISRKYLLVLKLL